MLKQHTIAHLNSNNSKLITAQRREYG